MRNLSTPRSILEWRWFIHKNKRKFWSVSQPPEIHVRKVLEMHLSTHAKKKQWSARAGGETAPAALNLAMRAASIAWAKNKSASHCIHICVYVHSENERGAREKSNARKMVHSLSAVSHSK